MSFEKKVLQSGVGLQKPNKLSRVIVDITGKWNSTEEGGVTFDTRKKASVQLDDADDELGCEIEDLICSMQVGEEALYTLHRGSDLFAHSLLREGETGSLHSPMPPKDDVVTYHIHLVAMVTHGQEVWSLTDSERLETAQSHKEKGSLLFKTKNFRGASIRYSKAVKYIAPVYLDNPYETLEKDIMRVKMACLLNLAACQLQMGLNHHVVTNCSKVLEVEPKNVKALYRRAKASLARSDYDTCREDLVSAKELDSSNQALGALMKALDTQETAHKAKYRDILKTMFE